MVRLLLIDDEAAARRDLRHLLAAHPSCTVVGEAANVGEARSRLAFADYDLVFLDIQLVGGSGFDLVPDVRPAARIVFVTAFDRHALRAFEVNALDYLLKPVAPARLAAALARRSLAAPPAPVAASVGALTLEDTVYLKTGTHSGRFVRVSDICRITSSANYTDVALADGAVCLVRRPLKEWAAALPADFVRAHRTVLVNTARITAVQRVNLAVTHLRLVGLQQPVQASYRFMGEVNARLAARGAG